jgi:hypothetical protein
VQAALDISNIRPLKVKTLRKENISSKADTMEDEISSLSFLKIILIPLATYILGIR